ncbi:putative Vacuolar protein sorting-associated protein 60.1 [Paratrimastix pyriformis]|uniref:Vacuolar protein sorting-associated protein 60.1 n=1 Tax=Paratrimastix pyriformis TaxID=342808 RepID=A0ABQ8U0C0_9EUKA|nr:putative Vacuolar protein sorting-associated protein 60.1 [Paratrimastix pyriformis]
MINRLFGSKKAAGPAPTLDDVSQKLGSRQDSLQERIQKLDQELIRLRDRMKQMRPGPAQNQVKQQALRILRQKKMYENQLGAVQNQAFNVDQTTFATQSMRDTVTTVSAMKGAAKELKQSFKGMRIESIDSLQDEMEDLMAQSSEMQEALGRTYDLPENYVSEDDLEAELGGLEEEMAALPAEQQGVPSYLQERAPAVPTEMPSVPTAEPAMPLTTR